MKEVNNWSFEDYQRSYSKRSYSVRTKREMTESQREIFAHAMGMIGAHPDQQQVEVAESWVREHVQVTKMEVTHE